MCFECGNYLLVLHVFNGLLVFEHFRQTNLCVLDVFKVSEWTKEMLIYQNTRDY